MLSLRTVDALAILHEGTIKALLSHVTKVKLLISDIIQESELLKKK